MFSFKQNKEVLDLTWLDLKCILCHDPTIFCSSLERANKHSSTLRISKLKKKDLKSISAAKILIDYNTKPANENSCTFLGQLASLLEIPFKGVPPELSAYQGLVERVWIFAKYFSWNFLALSSTSSSSAWLWIARETVCTATHQQFQVLRQMRISILLLVVQ